jgi:hypothetical protein
MELSEKLYKLIVGRERISDRFGLYMIFRGQGLISREAFDCVKLCETTYKDELLAREYSFPKIQDKFERLEAGLDAISPLFDFGED